MAIKHSELYIKPGEREKKQVAQVTVLVCKWNFNSVFIWKAIWTVWKFIAIKTVWHLNHWLGFHVAAIVCECKNVTVS